MKIALIIIGVLILAALLFLGWLFCVIAKDDKPNRTSSNFPFQALILFLLISFMAHGQQYQIQTLKADSNLCCYPIYRPTSINAIDKRWADTTTLIIGGYSKPEFTYPNIIESLRIADTFPPKYDTIPVLMLVGDTSHAMCETYEFSLDTTRITDTSRYFIGTRGGKWVMQDHGYKNHMVWWIMGYEVREAYGYWGSKYGSQLQGRVTYDGAAYWNTAYNHIAYLDDDKKPLPATYVIWMAKEINPQSPKFIGL